MSKNLTVEQEMNLNALKMVHQPILDQLAALRATRGQREVGSIEIPRHLQSPEVVKLHTEAGDGRACKVCGRGLRADAGEDKIGVCAQCANDPSSDIGVEQRANIAGNVLPIGR